MGDAGARGDCETMGVDRAILHSQERKWGDLGGREETRGSWDGRMRHPGTAGPGGA